MGCKMKKIWILFMLLSSLLILAGCGGGGGGGGDDEYYDDGNNLSKLASMNITDAKSVFISKGSGSGTNSLGMNSTAKSSGNSSTSRLYKINIDDKVEKISFFDKNNNEITLNEYGMELVPVFLENINNDYLAVGFSDTWSAAQNYMYSPQVVLLARKSDGAIFRLKDTIDCSQMNNGYGFVKNKGVFSSDENNNIYYLANVTDMYTCQSRILKLSVSGSDMTSIPVTPSSIDWIYNYEVDKKGNVYWEGQSNLLMASVRKITPGNGGNLVDPPVFSNIWKDQDGLFHYIDGRDIKIINPESFVSEPYGTFPDDPNSSWTDFKVSLNGYTYLMSYGGILEVYNPGKSPRSVNLGFSIGTVYGVTTTENYYYIAGCDDSYPVPNDFLIRVTPGGNSYISLLGNDYRVYAFAASETDGITFNALHKGNLKKVMGNISNSGVVSLLNYERDEEVVVLERIR